MPGQWRFVANPEAPIQSADDTEATSPKPGIDTLLRYLCVQGTKQDYCAFILSPLIVKYAYYFRLPLSGKGIDEEQAKVRKLAANVIEPATLWIEKVLDEDSATQLQYFKSNMAEAASDYLTAQGIDATRYVGSLLYHCDRDLQAYAKLYDTDPSSATAMLDEGEYDEFEKLFDRQVPEQYRNQWRVQLPPGLVEETQRLRGEMARERYNRIWLTFWAVHVETGMKGLTRWNKLPIKSEEKFRGKPLWWDKPVTSSLDEEPSSLGPIAAAATLRDQIMPLKEYKNIDCSVNLQLEDGHQEYLEKMEDQVGWDFRTTLLNAPNPAAYHEISQWRNDLRDALRFRDFRMDFNTIKYKTMKSDGAKLQRGELLGQKVEMDIETLYHILQEPETHSVVFNYTIYPHTSYEPEIVIQRTDTRAFLNIVNNDVEIAHTDPLEPVVELAKVVLPERRAAHVPPADESANPTPEAPKSESSKQQQVDGKLNEEDSGPEPEVVPRDTTGASAPSFVDQYLRKAQPDADVDAAEAPKTSNAVYPDLSSRPPAVPNMPPLPSFEHVAEDSWLDFVAANKETTDDAIQEVAIAQQRAFACVSYDHGILKGLTDKRFGVKRLMGASHKDGEKKMTKHMRHTAQLEAQRSELIQQGWDKMNLTSLAAAAKHKFEKPRDARNPNLFQFRTPTDEFAFSGMNKEDFIKQEYSGINAIDSNEGRIQWIRRALESVALGKPSQSWAGANDKSFDFAKFEELQKQFRDLMGHADLPSTHSSNEKFQGDEDETQYHPTSIPVAARESAMLGDEKRAGPQVDDSLRLLDMKRTEVHKGTLGKYRSPNLLPKVGVGLLASQLTGMVHILYRTCGTFPLSVKQKQQQDTYSDIMARLDYDGPKVQGGFLEDAPGMGKTFTTLAFFSWWALHADHTNDDGMPDHRPSLLLCPDGYVLRQWTDAINEHFKDIELIVAKTGDEWDRKTSDPMQRFEYISKDAIENPSDLAIWPKKLHYIFDKNNAKASRTIIISSYSTWRSRTIRAERLPDDIQKGQKPGWDWVRNAKRRPAFWERHVLKADWAEVFAMALLDEGHVIRNDQTQQHWMVRRLAARINWLLTATPMVNGANDVPKQVRLFWAECQAILGNDPGFPRFVQEMEKDEYVKAPWKIWKWVEENEPKTSNLRLIQLNPDCMIALLRSTKYRRIALYSKYFDNLAAIRRSPASKLPGFEGGYLDLSLIMPEHETRTVSLDHAEDDKSEYLWWHRKATREHALACQRRQPGEMNRQTGRKDKGIPPNVGGPLRRMAICTASTRLARFNKVLEEDLKLDTTVQSIKDWRNHSLNADMFLEITRAGTSTAAGAPRPSRIDRLKELAKGSPKFVEILRHVKEYVLPLKGSKDIEQGRFQKLLLTEEFPLIAWFWELLLNFLHIPTQVVHSSLDEHEREAVVDSFRTVPAPGDYSHLTVCILMYTINASGTNLDKDCNRVIVTTAANNCPVEIQAFSRVIRVSQTKKVYVTRLCVNNSHDEWRDALQANKALIDLATKAYSDEMMNYLVDLMNNEGRVEINQIQKYTFLGQQMRKKYLECRSYVKSDEQNETSSEDDDEHRDSDTDADAEKSSGESEVDVQSKVSSRKKDDDGSDEEEEPDDVDDEIQKQGRIGSATAGSDLPGDLNMTFDGAQDTPDKSSSDDSNSKNDSDGETAARNATIEDQVMTGAGGGDDEEEWEDEEEEGGNVVQVEEMDVDSGEDAGNAGEGAEDSEEAEEDEVEDEDDLTYEDKAEDEDSDSRNKVLDEEGNITDESDVEVSKHEIRDLLRDRAEKNAKAASGNHGGEDDGFGSQDVPEIQDDIFNVTHMTRKWKKRWEKLDIAKRETFDQTQIYYAYIAQQDPDKDDWTREDLLHDEIAFERALRLANRGRFGQLSTNLRVTPYINYAGLGAHAKEIEKRINEEKGEWDIKGLKYALGMTAAEADERARALRIKRKQAPDASTSEPEVDESSVRTAVVVPKLPGRTTRDEMEVELAMKGCLALREPSMSFICKG